MDRRVKPPAACELATVSAGRSPTSSNAWSLPVE
jgi:hypothetical protein